MQKRCLYPECGRPLPEGDSERSWDGRYCDERCEVLDLIVKSLVQLRDPGTATVAEVRLVAEAALRASYAFAFRVVVDPRRSELRSPSTGSPL